MSTITGKIKVIGPVETFGSNGFQKRNLVIVTEEQYPQTLQLEFKQGNCPLLDNRKVDETVKVSYNLQGREWLDQSSNEIKYFNSIVGWKIELVN